MRVISKARLVAFWQAQPAAERPLRAWYQDAAHAQWQSPQDNRQHCAGASFLAGNRVVFDIKGDHYRLVVAVAYRQGALFIKFVGTHAQYDAINATIVEPAPSATTHLHCSRSAPRPTMRRRWRRLNAISTRPKSPTPTAPRVRILMRL